MLFMKNLLLVLALSILIIGISCDNESGVSNDYKGNISGTIRNQSGDPIQNAELILAPIGLFKLSDESGRFTFNNLKSDVYSLTIRKESYLTQTIDVKVENNKISIVDLILDQEKVNQPPSKPNLVFPANFSTVSSDFSFSWNCSDPDGDLLTFSFLLGFDKTNLATVSDQISNYNFKLNNLEEQKTYFWRIIAKDLGGLVSESDIFSFTYSNQNQIQGLLLDLGFNGELIDNSPSRNQLTNFNVGLVSDRFGKSNSAAYFSGDSYIEIKQPKLMDFSKHFTVLAWIKPEVGYGNPYDGEVDIISRYGAAAPGESSFALSILNGILKAEIYNHTTKRNILETDYFVNTYAWQHIALVYDGSSLNLYHNGELAGRKTVSIPEKSNLSLLIGKRSTNNRFYKGSIDDILIFNKLLTQQEISKIIQ